MSRRSPRVIEAPLAVATDGSVVINAYWVSAGGASLDALVQTARKSGEKVFIGIAVPQPWKGRVIADLDELALERWGGLRSERLPGFGDARATRRGGCELRRADRNQGGEQRRALRADPAGLFAVAAPCTTAGPMATYANDNASKTAH